MQKMQAIIQGPDIGRGQQVSYLIIGQDIHQIQEKYGADAAATIISTTAAKIVFRQNDPDTAKRFAEMMGEKVEIKKTKGADGKETETTDRKPLYTHMDILKLDAKKQLVIFQGYYHRPIEADYCPAYADERLQAFRKLGECAPLPEFLVASHHAIMRYHGTPRQYDPMTKTTKELPA